MNDDFDNRMAALGWAADSERLRLDRSVSAICIGAKPHPFLREFGALLCVQGFYPFYDELQKGGFSVQPTIENGEWSTAIVCASKHKERTLFEIAFAAEHLSENGVVILPTPNDIGGKSLAKNAQKLFGSGRYENKHHITLFWAHKKSSSIDQTLLKEWLQKGSIRTIEKGYKTAAGVFSSQAIDLGSKLLIKTLQSETISGKVADIGAGWGALAKEILNPAITELVLYEADYNALELAKINITSKVAAFVWCDATKLEKKNYFDTIVMNPPFHSEAQTSTTLGIALIKSARTALKNGGKLYMVANAQLPYENHLKTLFTKIEILVRTDGYKVIKAISQ
ncbi:methyltransferase [Campylobacterota bacterium]|nr:methyltransferase [Campylobacterota bacterium]